MKRLAFLTNASQAQCPTERLWAGAAVHLAHEGWQVHALVGGLEDENAGWGGLEHAGISVGRRAQHSGHTAEKAWLRRAAPDLVFISQGSNVDAGPFMSLCLELGMPYCVCIHATSSTIWPEDDTLDLLRKGYQNARMVWADSTLGLEMTETMLGISLPRKGTLFNPPLLDPKSAPPPFPAVAHDTWKFACVARLFPAAKGQDILLQALSQPEWEGRNWRLTLVGEGPQRVGLETLAGMLGIQHKVDFPGTSDDMRGIWADHHLCVMPSRYEGLPIALTEALYCSRPCVITRETGGEDVMKDAVHGFIAPFATATIVNEALNRAWEHRLDWKAMGESARAMILSKAPANPSEWFSQRLRALA